MLRAPTLWTRALRQHPTRVPHAFRVRFCSDSPIPPRTAAAPDVASPTAGTGGAGTGSAGTGSAGTGGSPPAEPSEVHSDPAALPSRARELLTTPEDKARSKHKRILAGAISASSALASASILTHAHWSALVPYLADGAALALLGVSAAAAASVVGGTNTPFPHMWRPHFSHLSEIKLCFSFFQAYPSVAVARRASAHTSSSSLSTMRCGTPPHPYPTPTLPLPDPYPTPTPPVPLLPGESSVCAESCAHDGVSRAGSVGRGRDGRSRAPLRRHRRLIFRDAQERRVGGAPGAGARTFWPFTVDCTAASSWVHCWARAH